MRFAAVGAAIDHRDTGLDSREERHRAIQALRVNRGRQPER